MRHEPLAAEAESFVDPRLAGAALSHLLPHPLAALHHKMSVTPYPAVRYGCALRLAEAILRMLACAATADAVAQGAPSGKSRKWIRSLFLPSMGRFANTFRSAATWVGTRDPFMPEATDLAEGPALDPFEALRIDRNEYAHHFLAWSPGQAVPAFRRMGTALSRLLQSVSFLANYRLGTAVERQNRGHGSLQYRWIGCRGLEEEMTPVPVKAPWDLQAGGVLLFAPTTRRALVLSPLYWRTPAREVAFMLWLDGPPRHGDHSPPLEHARTVIYRHPLLQIQEARRLPGPFDVVVESDSPTDAEEYLAGSLLDSPSDWFRRFSIEPVHSEDFSAGGAPLVGVDSYRRVGRIGSGSRSTVWEVEHTTLRVRRALKVMSSGSATGGGGLLDSARLMAGLDHPNIARVFHAGVDGAGCPFIELELLRGESLDEILTRGPLGREEALGIVGQVLEAIEHAHARGVLHRDLKPSNIIRTADGVRVTDFGLGPDPDLNYLVPAEPRTDLGNRQFVAPECRVGPGDERSDVYAVGRILYSALTGESPPVQGSGLPSSHLPLDLSTIGPIIDRATQPRPDDRYDSATAMLSALKDWRVPVYSPSFDPETDPRLASTRFVPGTDLAKIDGRLDSTLAALLEAADRRRLAQYLAKHPRPIFGLHPAPSMAALVASMPISGIQCDLITFSRASDRTVVHVTLLGPLRASSLESEGARLVEAKRLLARFDEHPEDLLARLLPRLGEGDFRHLDLSYPDQTALDVSLLLGRRDDSTEADRAARKAVSVESGGRLFVRNWDALLDPKQSRPAQVDPT